MTIHPNKNSNIKIIITDEYDVNIYKNDLLTDKYKIIYEKLDANKIIRAEKCASGHLNVFKYRDYDMRDCL